MVSDLSLVRNVIVVYFRPPFFDGQGAERFVPSTLTRGSISSRFAKLVFISPTNPRRSRHADQDVQNRLSRVLNWVKTFSIRSTAYGSTEHIIK